MNILSMDEHKDGSATIGVDCTAEEVEFLIGYAIRDILRKSADNMSFNSKDYVYEGSMFPHCTGQGYERRCPVCGIYTNDMLPTSWHEGNEDHLRTYHAFFCKEHGPKELEWNKSEWDG